MGAILTNSWLLLASACACYFDATVATRIRNFGIYGGTCVNITEVPFMAIFTTTPYDHHCGASIVHEQFLVTAAHCVMPGANLAKVGTDNIYEGDQYDVEKIVTHPKFNMQRIMDYDIAVIKLKNKLTFSDRVQPITMADYSLKPSPGEIMETIGFGLTENGELSTHLLKVNIPYVDRDKCAKAHSHLVTDRMICAGGEKGKASCNGDSGGPLFYRNQLIGVTSWGHVPCAVEGYPVVYSYVPSMRNFIDDVIKNNS